METKSSGIPLDRINIFLWVDKLLLLSLVIIPMLFGVVGFILVYFVNGISCWPHLDTYGARNISWTTESVESYCWSQLRPYYNYTTERWIWEYFYNTTANQTIWRWVYRNVTEPRHGTELPHRMFPLLKLCEAFSFALPMFLWYLFVGKQLKQDITAILEYAGILSQSCIKYEKGDEDVNDDTIRRDVDNYLDYITHMLNSKVKWYFAWYVVKCVVILLWIIAWFIGYMFLVSNNLNNIFPSAFNCLYDVSYGGYFLAYCNISYSYVLMFFWCVNMALLLLLFILIVIDMIIQMCCQNGYEDTFMYSNIPGANDCRIAGQMNAMYGSHYCGLLSKYCYANESVVSNPGVRKSLCRKYELMHDQETDTYYRRSDVKAPLVGSDQVEHLKRSRKNASSEETRSCFKGSKTSGDKQANGLDERHLSMANGHVHVVSKENIENANYRQKKNQLTYVKQNQYVANKMYEGKLVSPADSSSGYVTDPHGKKIKNKKGAKFISNRSILHANGENRDKLNKHGKKKNRKKHGQVGLLGRVYPNDMYYETHVMNSNIKSKQPLVGKLPPLSQRGGGVIFPNGSQYPFGFNNDAIDNVLLGNNQKVFLSENLTPDTNTREIIQQNGYQPEVQPVIVVQAPSQDGKRPNLGSSRKNGTDNIHPVIKHYAPRNILNENLESRNGKTHIPPSVADGNKLPSDMEQNARRNPVAPPSWNESDDNQYDPKPVWAQSEGKHQGNTVPNKHNGGKPGRKRKNHPQNKNHPSFIPSYETDRELNPERNYLSPMTPLDVHPGYKASYPGRSRYSNGHVDAHRIDSHSEDNETGDEFDYSATDSEADFPKARRCAKYEGENYLKDFEVNKKKSTVKIWRP